MKIPVASLKMLFVSFIFCPALNAEPVFHDLQVHLIPMQSLLAVSDSISFPASICASQAVEFQLHSGLNPVVLTPGVALTPMQGPATRVPTERYQLKLPKGVCRVELSYGGVIHHPPESDLSPGTIESRGVFLGGATWWYPVMDGQLLSFRAEVSVAKPWSVVSQGELLSSVETGENTEFVWQELLPQDDMYLIAAHFHRYTAEGQGPLAEAWLRTPDAELAESYLQATLGYLELYAEMIGPYPYKKFSLVENFWATGYGMPSFTLLGSSVIRLPFILYTSYPHEILHNWWGNGVYVDYQSGNWSEGITSYLADHYFKAQRGQGHEYRRDALNDFASYVNPDNDFPVSEFISRYDKASSAIGYGKVLMLFHMLKIQLGEETFLSGLRHFYRENLFRRSSYKDLRDSFEAVSGKDLSVFFNQWVSRTGAPHLAISQADVRAIDGQWTLQLQLQQTQMQESFELHIPIQLQWPDGRRTEQLLSMTEKHQIWNIESRQKPSALVVDPHFDVFRHLYREEVPSSLAQTFGSESELTVVLPSNSPALDKYRQLAGVLQSRIPGGVTVIEDKDLKEFPDRGRVWLMGWSTKFASTLSCLFGQQGGMWKGNSVVIDGSEWSKASHALIVTFKAKSVCTSNPNQVVWTGFPQGTDSVALGSKMFHYGSYSYIGFDEQLKNQLKGQWEAKGSPLRVDF